MDLTLHDPDKTAKLRELERRVIGSYFAAQYRQGYLSRTPDAFRGTAYTCEAATGIR